MFSLSQIYGFTAIDDAKDVNRSYRPIELSEAAKKAAFRKAETLREYIYSEDAENWNTALYQWRAGELSGMEEVFTILGIVEDYFRFLR